MRALILAAALLTAGAAANAQYNDPSQASPANAPPVNQTSPVMGDNAATATGAADPADTADTVSNASDPTTGQLSDTVSLPKCSRKVTDRCAERR